MPSEIDWLAKRNTLRATAEALLPNFGKVFPEKNPSETLLNELLIHKVELEVQIDELRRANVAMEESRDRYLDLYDNSTMGFMTINRSGIIIESNIKASKWFGIDRLKNQHVRFSSFIVQSELEKWNLFFIQFMDSDKHSTHHVSIELIRKDMSTFNAYIDCQRILIVDGETILRLTVLELNQHSVLN